MATHDYVIDNQSAPAFRADLNNALQAIVTQNSSASAPTTTYANMIWYDTANNQLKKRNEADSGWITLGTLDETAGSFFPSAVASQVQAEAGTNDTTVMTPLKTANAIAALAAGSDVNLQVFTASSTYTPTTGYTKALIICTGGGEGGEACTTTNGDKGFGGNAGATAFAFSNISGGAAQTVTIGAGGTSSLGNGGATSVGSLCSASGGGATYAVTGLLGIQGGEGGKDDAGANFGGGSFWGGGPRGTNGGEAGRAAQAYGAGGSGASGTGSALAGGTGKSGVVFILEFKS